MEFLELVKSRRSIRKYTNEQIAKEDLEKIMQAGTYAPNAGGGQRTMLVGIHNQKLCDNIGKYNVACMDRSKLIGSFVSKEQPSIIDDPTIQSGFYGAPCVVAIFAPSRFLYSIPDSFCIAENIILMATEKGISSCIVCRGEETFDNDFGKELLKKWNVPEGYVCRAFVTLGYCDGEQPHVKERKPWRTLIVEE